MEARFAGVRTDTVQLKTWNVRDALLHDDLDR
jgi:hypothetical protein